MRSERWSGIIRLGAVYTTLAFMLLIAASLEDQHQAGDRYAGTRHEHREVQQLGEVASVSPPVDPASSEDQPAPPQGDPARDEWREEQDLLIQGRVARSSEWTVVLTGIGLILIALTLWEASKGARSAAKALRVAEQNLSLARALGLASNRGYFSVRRTYLELPRGGGIFRVGVVVHNSGESPGRNAMLYVAGVALFRREWTAEDGSHKVGLEEETFGVFEGNLPKDIIAGEDVTLAVTMHHPEAWAGLIGDDSFKAREFLGVSFDVKVGVRDVYQRRTVLRFEVRHGDRSAPLQYGEHDLRMRNAPEETHDYPDGLPDELHV